MVLDASPPPPDFVDGSLVDRIARARPATHHFECGPKVSERGHQAAADTDAVAVDAVTIGK
jgi:hypothetical protein